MRDDLQAAETELRRNASIVLTVYDLGRATGKSAPVSAFRIGCGAEELDRLVALRQARRVLDSKVADLASNADSAATHEELIEF